MHDVSHAGGINTGTISRFLPSTREPCRRLDYCRHRSTVNQRLPSFISGRARTFTVLVTDAFIRLLP